MTDLVTTQSTLPEENPALDADKEAQAQRERESVERIHKELKDGTFMTLNSSRPEWENQLALHIACEVGDIWRVRVMLDHPAYDPNNRCFGGHLLHHAHNRPQMVKLIMDHPRFDVQVAHLEDAFSRYLLGQLSAQLVYDMIIHPRLGLDTTVNGGQTVWDFALRAACYNNRPILASLLMARPDAPYDLRDANGMLWVDRVRAHQAAKPIIQEPVYHLQHL